MSREVELYLADILEECDKVLAFTSGMDVTVFVHDAKTRHAVAYALLSIGEAVKHLPEELLNRDSEIEWSRVVGMRDRLAHGYFAIDPEIMWDVVTAHVPRLRVVVQRLLSDF